MVIRGYTHVDPAAAAAVASAVTSDRREIYPTPEDSCDEQLQVPIVATKQPILSRKEKREIKKLGDKEKKQGLEAAARIEVEEALKALEAQAVSKTEDEKDDEKDCDEEDAGLSKNQRKKIAKKKRQQHLQQTRISQPNCDSPPSTTDLTLIKPTIPRPPTMPPTNMPLLVCSIGNPGSTYANTLHSAGHTILSIIRDRGLYNPFLRGLSGSVATPNTTRYSFSLTGYTKDTSPGTLGPDEDNFTLWQSTKQMNISGPSVQQAWRKWSAEQRAKGHSQCRLVVVHDELESELGKVGIKMGSASPRGHNGLKSVQASMGSTPWWRVGVGIGRPESRDPDVVAKYVLRKMNAREQLAMDKASVGVLKALRQIAEGKA